ncbi:MAG: CRTAC1 family protein [Planctomycetota bacterium]
MNATVDAGIDFVNAYGPLLPYDADMSENDVLFLDIMQRNAGNGAAVGDYDNDGDLDVLVLGQKTHRSALYRNDLPAGFTDVTKQAGIHNRGLSRIAMFADLDNDGWADLILANDARPGAPYPSGDPLTAQVALPGGRGVSPFAGQQHAPSSIYRNKGDGTFADVTPGSGFDIRGRFVGGMGLVDFDEDGRLDIYVALWGAQHQQGHILLEGHNRLYRNEGGFQFRDVTRLLGLGTLLSNSWAPVFADFDLDGDDDLFIAEDDAADKYYDFGPGLGEFARLFTDVSTAVGTTHVGTDMGVAPVDFDDDGDLDLFVTNVTENGNGGNALYVNQLTETGQLSFVDEAAARGVFDTGWGWGTEWVDVDNDGDRDLFAVNGFDEYVMWLGLNFNLVNKPADLFLNDGTGNFTKTSGTGAEVVGDARAAIAFDADRDGDQDLFVTHVDGPPALLLNTLNDRGTTNHWLDVKLVGGGLVNRDALGSRVEVTAGGKTQVHYVLGGGSFLAGRSYEAHFGLGAATTADLVRVHWTDGMVSDLVAVPVDQLLVVTYP